MIITSHLVYIQAWAKFFIHVFSPNAQNESQVKTIRLHLEKLGLSEVKINCPRPLSW